MTLIEEIKKIKSSKKDLRSFGITLGVFFTLLALLFLWRRKDLWPLWTGLSVYFLFFGLVLPDLLKPIQKVWMTLALMMGWVMTRVILSILFFSTITPIRWISSLTGKKFLDHKKNDNKSYWISRKEKIFEKSSYEKQF